MADKQIKDLPLLETDITDDTYFICSNNGTVLKQVNLAQKQDKLTAGTNITIKDNVISATADMSDYLPLTGGIMTGNITFTGNADPGLWFDTNTGSQCRISGVSDGRLSLSPVTYLDVRGQGIRNANSGKWYLDESKIGAASGVAGLDSNSLVPTDNLPIDGTTITVNTDGKLSASGSSGGSGIDFEGTKAEFDAAVTAGTITDDSVSLITDDVSGDTVATKADLAVVDQSKADTALSNVLANIDYVVESKLPTTDDPTWYRVWKSGWVEQGGKTTSVGFDISFAITLPKTMLNGDYIALTNYENTKQTDAILTHVMTKTTTTLTVATRRVESAASGTRYIIWEVKGQGAN